MNNHIFFFLPAVLAMFGHNLCITMTAYRIYVQAAPQKAPHNKTRFTLEACGYFGVMVPPFSVKWHFL